MEKNIKDKTPINTLPEYQIRTMKDDLASQGLGKEAKTKGAPPEKLPIITGKTALPTIEELMAKEEKAVKGKKVKKEKPAPEPKPKKPKAKPKPLVILIIAAIILAGIALFFYWQGLKAPSLPPEDQQPQTESIKPSESLILVDKTKILSLLPEASLPDSLKQNIKQESQNEQGIGTFKRIAILKNEKEFLSLTEFFEKLQLIVPPYALTELLGPNYTLALYNQNKEKHLVLVSEVKNSENLKEQIKFWEKTMFNDLKNFFLAEIPGQPSTLEFEEIAYPPTIEPDKQAAIRYLNFSDPSLTFDYTVIKDVFVLTTNREAMYKIVDNLLKSID